MMRKRRLQWDFDAWEDYLDWQRNDKKILKRINQLIREVVRDPFCGMGKPEPLRGNLAGFWSVRIDDKNRIVFKVSDNMLEIAQYGSHYRDK